MRQFVSVILRARQTEQPKNFFVCLARRNPRQSEMTSLGRSDALNAVCGVRVRQNKTRTT